ncbi:MAG TPA: Fn3-like domain-containing protein [Candidatus Saccharimonadales bacterium]|nr:Fn3-like domain-containing protein [Candidatus Saccharimonadales bacterium]
MAIVIACVPLGRANAAGNDFNIQVSPSPLVVSLTPGQTQTATLTVRNFSNHSESLNPGLKGVHTDSGTQKVSLNTVLPADIGSWTHLAPSTLTIEPGQSKQLTVTFNTPSNVGFSYPVAVTLTSTRAESQTSTGTAIKPQVVVFTLININRSDAKSGMEITSFKSEKSRYTFLPANFSVTVKNTGNIISQPSGTIFIQHSASDSKPIATIPINKGGGYILPGTSRTFTTSWKDGFPVYETGQDGKNHLKWDWKHLNELRFGHYTAKAVVIYDNGQQDVPLTATASFWVVPWLLLLGALVVIALLIMGILTWGKLVFLGTKKVRGYAHRTK